MFKRPTLQAYLFLAPALIVFVLFIFYPTLEVFRLSFTKYTIFQSPEFVGLSNYLRLIHDSDFWYALLNSFIYLLVTPALIVLSLGIAFLLSEKVVGKGVFRFIYFLPVITPAVVAGIAWKWLFNEDIGFMNYLVTLIGGQKLHWLTDYPLNLFSVMIVTIWRGLGFYMIIFLAAILGIPKELEEAAKIDGASGWQALLYVKLPLMKPTIAMVAIISAIEALKVFDEIYIMIQNAPVADKTAVPFIYSEAFTHFNMGYASAASVILFIVTLVFSYLNAKYWREV